MNDVVESFFVYGFFSEQNRTLVVIFMSRKSPDSKVIYTTSSVLKENKSVFDSGMDSLLMYIERNATWELQKAFVIVMGTALADWNEGVIVTRKGRNY